MIKRLLVTIVALFGCTINAFNIISQQVPSYSSRSVQIKTSKNHLIRSPLRSSSCGASSYSSQWHTQQRTPSKEVSLFSSKDDMSGEDPYEDDPIFSGQTTLALVGSQSLLVVGSVIAAVILGIPNFGLGSTFSIDSNSFQIGLISTVPLLLLAVVLDVVEKAELPGSSALIDVTRATNRSVLALLGGTRKPLLAIGISLALGLAAGWGEELLFRGILQTALMERFGDVVALSCTAVIFGALHAVTPLYAILASIASGYFGTLYIQSDNLAVPIICHTFYDVAALLWAHYVVTALPLDERLKLAGMDEQINDEIKQRE